MAIRLRALLGPLGLMLASVLVALAIGEVLVRLAFPPVPETLDEELVTSGAYQDHPVIGWLPRPNASGHSKRFNSTFRTNSRGLRDREHSLERTPGVRRIVMLGDSFAWGWGVNDHEVFASVLETRLERTEVVNLGVTAFALAQEFEYLKLEGALYQPDIVVLAFCQNDINRGGQPAPTFRPAATPRAPRARPPGFSGWLKQWLDERLVLYRVARQGINTSPALVKALVALGIKDELMGYDGVDSDLTPALRNYPPKLQSSFEATLAELMQMRDWLAERKIRFVIALIPALQAIEPRAFLHSIAYTVYNPSDFDLDKPYRNLEAFARGNGIEVINAVPALRRRRETGETLYLANDIHFNAAGHAAFAAEIAAYLQRAQ